MTPENSKIHPEYFLHDACLPVELQQQVPVSQLEGLEAGIREALGLVEGPIPINYVTQLKNLAECVAKWREADNAPKL